MKKILALLLFISLNGKSQFRNNFLGTYTGRVDIYDIGGHFMGTDEIFVNPSPTDSNNIVITDTIPWLNFEYTVHLDSTFTDIWQPFLRYGYFYANGDSIFVHDVHNAPYYREWHCGRVGAGVKEITNSLFSVYPNPASNKIFISSNQSWDNLKVTLFNSVGQIALKKNLPSFSSKIEIDLTHLPDGIYFLSIKSSSLNSSQKIIIKN